MSARMNHARNAVGEDIDEVLTSTASDEALEAAAGGQRQAANSWGAESTISPYCFGCVKRG